MISMDVTVEWMNHMHIVSNLLSILNMNHVVRLLPQWILLKRMHPLGKTLCYKNHFVIDFSNTTTVSLNFHHTHTQAANAYSVSQTNIWKYTRQFQSIAYFPHRHYISRFIYDWIPCSEINCIEFLYTLDVNFDPCQIVIYSGQTHYNRMPYTISQWSNNLSLTHWVPPRRFIHTLF